MCYTKYIAFGMKIGEKIAEFWFIICLAFDKLRDSWDIIHINLTSGYITTHFTQWSRIVVITDTDIIIHFSKLISAVLAKFSPSDDAYVSNDALKLKKNPTN